MSAWSAFRFFPSFQPALNGPALTLNGQTAALAIGSEAEWEAKRLKEEEADENSWFRVAPTVDGKELASLSIAAQLPV